MAKRKIFKNTLKLQIYPFPQPSHHFHSIQYRFANLNHIFVRILNLDNYLLNPDTANAFQDPEVFYGLWQKSVLSEKINNFDL